jgi:superfamily II DNA/RNA helicase
MKTNHFTQSKIELIKNNHTKNIASPFINHKKTWQSEESYQIPQDLIKNIEDNLGFKKPSTIQSVAIPLIVSEPFHSLIA